jgi:hypothetical protein
MERSQRRRGKIKLPNYNRQNKYGAPVDPTYERIQLLRAVLQYQAMMLYSKFWFSRGVLEKKIAASRRRRSP